MSLKTAIRRMLICVLMVAALASVAMLSVSAAEKPGHEAMHWFINAEKIDEILAGKAGEETTGWEVPYLRIAPTLDGKINNGEYFDFELYEDYLSYMAVDMGNTEEDFLEFYESAKSDFFDAYWGWDGTYLYVAFEINCINGFTCKPEELGGNTYLYAYNAIQIALSPVDAVGKDPDYVELGYGVHSETGASLTTAWAGPYYPTPEEDFKGYYDVENQTVTYEVRIHLQKALGLTDRTVQNGDEYNYGWLISVNGETTGISDYWQVAFAHGIGGQYSHKCNQYLARITFTGLPDDANVEVEDIPGISEEDKTYGLKEFVDMSDEATVKTFSGENAAVDYITENGESFMRITALGDESYIWSSLYPRNLQGRDVTYVVVKYRTSSEKAEELGILYRSASHPEYSFDDLYTDYIGFDGEWHTMLFYMDSESRWINWIVNVGLVPFAYAEEAAGETLDIAFMKFYSEDPWELYKDTEYDPNKQTETTTAEDNDTAEVTVADTEEITTAPAATDAATGAAESETTGESENGGCASAMSMGALSICLLGAGAMLTRKKKENERETARR